MAQNIFLGHELKRGWLLDDAAMRSAARERAARGRPRDRPGHARARADRRREAAGRDRQGALAPRPPAGHGRADGDAHAERDGALVPADRPAEGGRRRRSSTSRTSSTRSSASPTRSSSCATAASSARAPTAEVTRHQMANLMVGRELSDMFPARRGRARRRPGAAREGPHRARLGASDVSFDVRPGEILGFAGLVGAGRTELFEGLLGLRPRSAGTIELDGRAVSLRQPARRRAARPDLSERGPQGQGPARALLGCTRT